MSYAYTRHEGSEKCSRQTDGRVMLIWVKYNRQGKKISPKATVVPDCQLDSDCETLFEIGSINFTMYIKHNLLFVSQFILSLSYQSQFVNRLCLLQYSNPKSYITQQRRPNAV